MRSLSRTWWAERSSPTQVDILRQTTVIWSAVYDELDGVYENYPFIAVSPQLVQKREARKQSEVTERSTPTLTSWRVPPCIVRPEEKKMRLALKLLAENPFLDIKSKKK